LRTQGKLTADANKAAGEANERASKAQENLGLAEQHAAEANEKAESFRLEIAKANERAETARLEQEKLKQLVQWRTIEPANMKVLITELAKGSGEIDIAFAPSDPETAYFALKTIGNDGFAAVIIPAMVQNGMCICARGSPTGCFLESVSPVQKMTKSNS
jgi:hypothetical protein